MQPYHLLPVVLVVSMLMACEKKANVPAQVPPPEVTAPKPAAPAATANSEFRRLLGKWQRPDGGYVIEIKGVDDSTGKLDAAYFNPQPINVSKAMATRDATSTRVFIELRGPNYPGSTYTLVYDPATDQLQGIYFQAAMQQQFEVIFQRLK
jgi:uncharacterized protein (DUF2147 family)